MSSPEMLRILDELAKAYGGEVVHVAQHLSGIRLCLKALASDHLDHDERETMHTIAGGHLAALLSLAVWGDQKRLARVAECALRIDEKVEEVIGPEPGTRQLH